MQRIVERFYIIVIIYFSMLCSMPVLASGIPVDGDPLATLRIRVSATGYENISRDSLPVWIEVTDVEHSREVIVPPPHYTCAPENKKYPQILLHPLSRKGMHNMGGGCRIIPSTGFYNEVKRGCSAVLV